MLFLAGGCGRSGLGVEHESDALTQSDNAQACDRDGDGHESVACGGDDCDDDSSACGNLCFPGNVQVCATSIDPDPAPDTDCDPATIACVTRPPVHAIVDDFSRSWSDALFNAYAEGHALVSDDGGYLTITPHVEEHSFAGWVTRYLFSVLGSSVAFEILEVTSFDSSANSVSYVQVENTSEDMNYAISIGAGIISFRDASTDLGSALYDPVQHRYCRLREASNTIYGECSADGTTWTALGSTVVAFDLSSVKLNIGAGTYAESPTAPGRFRVDNINSLP